MADDPPPPPPLVQFPLQDKTRGAFTYSAPVTPPEPTHDPVPTFKRSVWLLRLIFLGTLIALVVSLFMFYRAIEICNALTPPLSLREREQSTARRRIVPQFDRDTA
jgi:hypothetical protein